MWLQLTYLKVFSWRQWKSNLANINWLKWTISVDVVCFVSFFKLHGTPEFVSHLPVELHKKFVGVKAANSALYFVQVMKVHFNYF